jgi:Mg2+-importing ATPase
VSPKDHERGSSTAKGTTPAGRTFWSTPIDDLWADLQSAPDGLDPDEAAARLARAGPGTLVEDRRHGLRLLLAQFTSPIILILVAATAVSMVLGDLLDGAIILAIIVASGLLGFWQEHSAGRAVDALLERVQVEVTVRRGGNETPVPVTGVVVGDVVVLAAGDVVPGDARVVESRSLLVDETTLTGESYPVEKVSGAVSADAALTDRSNSVFMGTHVVSGRGTVLVAETGRDTEFGAVSANLREPDVVTSFERGVTQFGMLLVRVMVVMVTAVFVINLVLSRPLLESFLFSLALAVGITPQLLPAIVSVSLAAGAKRMASEQVIVKRLDAIEDFGAMTVLCCDKTGTITVGAARLDGALDVEGQPSNDVLRLARRNAALQTGFPNPLDAAILDGAEATDPALRLDEAPYDFQRKRLSVLVDEPSGPILITKGALDSVLSVCTTASLAGDIAPIEQVRSEVRQQFERRSADGYRVIAVAERRLATRTCAVDDERDMTLRGLLVFHDPPKEGAAEAIGDLATQGVAVRIVTGDNRLAAGKIAADVGLDAEVVTGSEIDELDDAALTERIRAVLVFAEVEPLHKERIVRALRRDGHTVGFLGDGINDAPALHAADIGISVDSAADVAKQAAAIVLLDKSLSVVVDGIGLGRQTFANTLKYIRVTTSANFGNVLSMAAAAALLPFLPLLPRQILLLNFLSDIPGIAIAGDTVDPEQLTHPRSWSLPSIRSFMIVYGLLSTAFDLATFAVLRLGFDAAEDVFRSGWFVISTITELAAMLVLRTNRRFYRSRPGRALLWSSVAIAAITIAIPYTALAVPLGLTALPVKLLVTLAGLTVLYVAANETAKSRRPTLE